MPDRARTSACWRAGNTGWIGDYKGVPYRHGIQADETAFAILLADALRRRNALNSFDPWPMVRKAVGFLVSNGPVTQQDRWEENSGYSPFTLAVEVAAMLAAAEFADAADARRMAAYLRETADNWNANIERWTYVTGTDLAKRVGVDGYYIRIAPPDVAATGDAASLGAFRVCETRAFPPR